MVRGKGILRGREISIQLDLRDLLTMRVGAETRAAALYALGSMVMFEPLPDGIQTAPFDELVDWAVDGILVVRARYCTMIVQNAFVWMWRHLIWVGLGFIFN